MLGLILWPRGFSALLPKSALQGLEDGKPIWRVAGGPGQCLTGPGVQVVALVLAVLTFLLRPSFLHAFLVPHPLEGPLPLLSCLLGS